MDIERKLQAELESFQKIWKGGFYSGNPRNPAFGLWGITAYIGVSHAIYLGCVRPYVDESTTVLEIGCGRGAWSKLMVHAKQFYCVDALSAEHNEFWQYVGASKSVTYFQAKDFSLENIPFDSIDFSFSYDALCHVSFEGITEYAKNLYPRLRHGGHAIWMVADYEKYNHFVDNQDDYSTLSGLRPRRSRPMITAIINAASRRLVSWNGKRHNLHRQDLQENGAPTPGRWYNAGRVRTTAMLQGLGYKVIDDDMGFDHRSPIIHFKKS